MDRGDETGGAVTSMRARGLCFAVLGFGALAAGCSGGTPLGGPFGGEGNVVRPTNGIYVDGGTYTPPEPPPPVAGGVPGTWNHIFGAYLQRGTIGDCGLCHPGEMRTASSSYAWLRDLEYVGTGNPPLTNFGQSCLAWYGGSMPPGALPPDQSLIDAIVQEMTTWGAAGGKND